MKNTIKYYVLVVLSILIASCSGSGSNSSNPTVNGTLSFNKTTIPITTGSTQTVILSLSSSNSNTIANADITIGDSQIASTNKPTCALSSATTTSASCKITITGKANGNTTITASASGFTSVSATIAVSGAAIPGKVVFVESSTPIYISESSTAVILLEDSSGVASETVNFTSSNPAISVSPTSCDVSTNNNYCPISLTASTTATATITATSASSGESTMLAIASTTPTAGKLTITPGAVLIAAQSGSQSIPATITLANSAGVHNLWVEVVDNSYDPSIASPGNITQNNIPVGYCCLSSNPESSTCNFNAIGAGTVGNTAISWQAAANGVSATCPAINADYTQYSKPSLTVTAANIVPTPRTFNIVNKCNFPVYFGISGGAVGNSAASQSDCPTNSTFVESKATCFWNNPTPSNGYALAANNGTTSVTIPASNYNGQEWSGGITGRTNCTESGLCETGGCTGTAPGSGGTSGLACAVSHGFSIPNSAAEFTLLNNGNDAYDVTLIGGVIVPVSMQPSNNNINPAASPYQCGNAGSATAQYGFFNGTSQTLYAANWVPNVPPTSGTSVATPAEAYNYVSGSSASNTSCSNGSAGSYTPNASLCSGALSGSVCGYTYDAINKPSPSYKYTCGSRIGWISAATIYAANSTNNLAPFGFNLTPNPNGSNPNNYSIGQWSQCVNPPFDSSYQVGSPDSQTCGGTNWVGIATPESGFMSSNLVWQQEILTRITWIKQACPTCYAYQFDDNSSSFTCQTSAGSTNPANATNYNVTFCPAN